MENTVKRIHTNDGPISIWGAAVLNLLILVGFGIGYLIDFKDIPVKTNSAPNLK